MPLMYEEHDTHEARVSAVCLKASLLALLVRKLFSTRNLFTLYNQKSSAIKIVSALKRRPAPPAPDEPGKWDDRETGATHFKLTALPV
jgi:hypothetical protein